MKITFAAVMLIITFQAVGQDTIMEYYNEKWELVTNLESMAYYRKAYKGTDKLWIVNDFYKSGQLQMTGTYKSLKSGTKHGWFTYYHENGVRKSERLFLNDVNVGEMRTWNKKGQLITVFTFSDGDILKEQAYYTNGQLKYQCSYKFNLQHGLCQFWDHNGRLILEGNFRNGERAGTWKRYLPDTLVTYTYHYGVQKQDIGVLIRGRDVKHGNE